MKRCFQLFLLLLFNYNYSQSPDILWQKRYGGSNRNASYSSQQTIDGGYIIGGRSNSNISFDKTENSKGSYDYWLVKTDNLGIIEWDKTIGASSPFNEQDIFFKIKQTPDNGFIICGYSDSPLSGDKSEEVIGGTDFWIVKTDGFGTIQWDNTIGGTSHEVPYALELTTDGGYIIGGSSSSDISGDKSEINFGSQDYWIVKLNSLGIVEWNKTYGGSSIDIITALVNTDDGGYLIGGNSSSNISGNKSENSRGLGDFWILKIDGIGNIIWQKTIGASESEHLSQIINTNDGFLLTGYSNSNISGEKTENSRGIRDYWIVKINNLGEVLWDKTIGGNNDDILLSALQSNDGGYMLSGSSDSNISGEKDEPNIGETDAWLVKTNNIGNIIWQKTIGGNYGDGINSINENNDGGYFLSGVTSSTISGSITESPKGLSDYWVVKLAPDILSSTEANTNQDVIIYPNPNNGTFNIKFKDKSLIKTISIFSAIGQLIYQESLIDDLNKTINFEGSTGIYFLKIETEQNKSTTYKILKK
jgi:hypothetical protein